MEIVASTRAGGFIGANNSYLTIFEGCSFEKSVTVTSTATGKTNNWAVGGYIGYETSDPQKYNPNGEKLNNNYAPSIVISSENKTSVKVVFNNCTSTGTISGNADEGYSKEYIGVEDKWAIIEGITGYNETSGHAKIELN